MTINDLLEGLSNEERDVVLRAFADKENEVRRAKQAARHRYDEGFNDAIKALIPHFDDLFRLVQSIQELGFSRGHLTRDRFVRHVGSPAVHITSKLSKLLETLGVGWIEATKDSRFDPASMEAVDVEYRTDIDPNTVIKEVLPGYVREGTLLRPASVVVARGV